MKKKFKLILAATLALTMTYVGFASAQLAGIYRVLNSYWFDQDKSISFGPGAPAKIQYTGGNLVIGTTSGTVKFPNGANVTGGITGNAATATALAAVPTGCSANQYANAIAANGNLTCSALTFLSGNLATIVDEVVTVSSNTGTLANLPAVVQNVYCTTGTTTGAAAILPTGVGPATHQVAITMTTGVLTFFATDSCTAAKVTYVKASGSVSGTVH